MGIKVQPSGMAKAYGDLAGLAAKSKAAKEREDRMFRIGLEMYQEEQRREMAIFDAQLNQEARKQARMWELEKMQMASRLDFEREERRRQQKLDERQARIDALNKAMEDGIIDKDDYDKMYLQVATGVPVYNQAQITARSTKTIDPIKQMTAEYMSRALGKESPETNIEDVKETGTIEPGEKVRVKTPDGRYGTIDTWEWPIYKDKGYTLAPITPKETKPVKLGEYPKGYKQFRGFYF